MEAEPDSIVGRPSSIEDFRQVYEGVALPVLIIDHESWRILEVNDAALAQYGYKREEFVGLPVVQLRPPEGRNDARRILSEMPHGVWKTTAVQHARKDGSRFSADVWSRDTVVEGRAVRVATVSDVTERVQLQQELQQAQKLEVMGQLAGGVAHEFNNALTAILGCTDLLLDRIRDDPEDQEDLEEIQRAARGAASLTQRLLALSRQQAMRVEICSLAEIAAETGNLLEQVLDDSIAVELRIDSATWPVRADATQLEQVVMNLAVNAQDAMPRGGRLALSTGNVSVGPGESDTTLGFPPGEYAELVVRDTGVGMDEITRARALEPFFTTKPFPEGTGLGLSTAYGIVRQIGGFMTLDSAPDEGTTFRILLPRADRPAPEPRSARPAPGPETPTILFVDREDEVRRFACRVLERMGYAVLSADSGEAALTSLKSGDRIPDLLVTALSLPGIDGRELADRVRDLDSDFRVLFLSGYSVESAGEPGAAETGERLLRKPFSVESLSEAVRRALSGSS